MVTGGYEIVQGHIDGSDRENVWRHVDFGKQIDDSGGSVEQIGEIDEIEMTCDVWKEKENVVVDFDPAIIIKMVDQFDEQAIWCQCVYIRKEYVLTSLTERNPCVLANVEESIPGNVCITKKKQSITMSFVLPTQRKKAINRVLIRLTGKPWMPETEF